MTDRALLQQALEALSRSDYLGWQLNIPIIKALRERLAQPEQRPVPPPWWPAVENILNEYGLQAIDFVDDFKKALAQPEQDAVLAEREACAQVCEEEICNCCWDDDARAAAEHLAAAIRARGNT